MELKVLKFEEAGRLEEEGGGPTFILSCKLVHFMGDPEDC